MMVDDGTSFYSRNIIVHMNALKEGGNISNSFFKTTRHSQPFLPFDIKIQKDCAIIFFPFVLYYLQGLPLGGLYNN